MMQHQAASWALPVELFDTIVSFLDCSATLNSCRQTCKKNKVLVLQRTSRTPVLTIQAYEPREVPAATARKWLQEAEHASSYKVRVITKSRHNFRFPLGYDASTRWLTDIFSGMQLSGLRHLELQYLTLDSLLPSVISQAAPLLEVFVQTHCRLRWEEATVSSYAVPCYTHLVELQVHGKQDERTHQQCGPSGEHMELFKQQLRQLTSLRKLMLRYVPIMAADETETTLLRVLGPQLTSLQIKMDANMDLYPCNAWVQRFVNLQHLVLQRVKLTWGDTNQLGWEVLLKLPQLRHLVWDDDMWLTRPLEASQCHWQVLEMRVHHLEQLAYLPLHDNLQLVARRWKSPQRGRCTILPLRDGVTAAQIVESISKCGGISWDQLESVRMGKRWRKQHYNQEQRENAAKDLLDLLPILVGARKPLVLLQMRFDAAGFEKLGQHVATHGVPQLELQDCDWSPQGLAQHLLPQLPDGFTLQLSWSTKNWAPELEDISTLCQLAPKPLHLRIVQYTSYRLPRKHRLPLSWQATVKAAMQAAGRLHVTLDEDEFDVCECGSSALEYCTDDSEGWDLDDAGILSSGGSGEDSWEGSGSSSGGEEEEEGEGQEDSEGDGNNDSSSSDHSFELDSDDQDSDDENSDDEGSNDENSGDQDSVTDSGSGGSIVDRRGTGDGTGDGSGQQKHRVRMGSGVDKGGGCHQGSKGAVKGSEGDEHSGSRKKAGVGKSDKGGEGAASTSSGRRVSSRLAGRYGGGGAAASAGRRAPGTGMQL